ncbi:CD59A glycoprotein-like isoform X1 [Sardina pilchardus]|uniref:CD59A glycoprotein-like isoform X1 n=2 Tax=Sardina pilchardus TaxID=27697 RepID=UPI002E15553D
MIVRIMKTLVLALVLLLAVSSFALDCNRCVPTKPGGTCTVTTETCPPEKDACAATKFLTPPYAYYQKCMRMSDCEMLQTNGYINIKCCQKDLCNVF